MIVRVFSGSARRAVFVYVVMVSVLTVMIMIVILPPFMVMRLILPGMAVQKPVPVRMHVIVKMVVHHPVVFMGMGVKMFV